MVQLFKKTVRISLRSFQSYSHFREASRNKIEIVAIFYSIDKSKSDSLFVLYNINIYIVIYINL